MQKKPTIRCFDPNLFQAQRLLTKTRQMPVNGALSPFSCRPRGALGQVQQFFCEILQGSTKPRTRLHSNGYNKCRPLSRREHTSCCLLGQSQLSSLGPTKQTISLAVCTSKALAIDRLLRNDKLTNLSQRGLGVTRRPPGAVGYNTSTQPPK